MHLQQGVTNFPEPHSFFFYLSFSSSFFFEQKKGRMTRVGKRLYQQQVFTENKKKNLYSIQQSVGSLLKLVAGQHPTNRGFVCARKAEPKERDLR